MNIIRKIAFIAVVATGLTATAQESITQRECWIDGNIAERQTIAEASAQIDITALLPGIHTFAMRVQRSDGNWSSPVTRFFLKLTDLVETTITHCRYWFDGNENAAVVCDIQSNRSTSTDVVEIDVSDLEQGEHTLSWMMGNSKGAWSQEYTETFTIELPTAIDTVSSEPLDSGCVWYNLNGQKLNGMPTAPGIYINGNKKVVIK